MPEEQSFEGRQVRDTAADVPANYEPPPSFSTAALQHTNVKLTWDADNDQRRRALSKRVTANELRDDDFKVGLDCRVSDIGHLKTPGLCFQCTRRVVR